MEHDLTKSPNDFSIRKMYNFDPYSVCLAIATNIPQRLMTGFVLQGHISDEKTHRLNLSIN